MGAQVILIKVRQHEAWAMGLDAPNGGFGRVVIRKTVMLPPPSPSAPSSDQVPMAQVLRTPHGQEAR